MAGIKLSKEHIFLIAILLFSFYLRILHIDGGFSQGDEVISDVFSALNVGTFSIVKWIDPRTYGNILYHGPLNAHIIAFVSNTLFLPVILLSGAPFPLNIDVLHWQHSNGVYIVEPLFRGVVILLSLLTIFLVYRIGREYGSDTGLISAFLLGTLSWYLINNYIVASYTAVTLAISMSLFLFYYGFINNNHKIILLSSIIAALSVYLTVLALIIPLICVLYLFISRKANQIPKKAIKLYALILLIPALIMLSIGGLRWAYGEFLGTILYATVKYQPTFFQLWDPKNGIFMSVEHPLIYFNVFLDYLSPVFIFFAIIGVTLAIGNVKNHAKSREIDILLLSWLFGSFILLNILNAKTPRYPTILLPPLVIFAANGIMWLSKKLSFNQNLIKYFTISILLIWAIYSQPHFIDYINEKYMIVTEDGGTIIDYRIAADYINPNITTKDTVLFGGRGMASFPWWYIKGNLSYDTTLDYWKKPDSKYVVIDQYTREGYGAGGGAVWLEGNFGKGKIILVSFNATEKADILKKITSGKDIGIFSEDDTVTKALNSIGTPAEVLREKPLTEFMTTHNLMIISSPTDNNRQFFKKNKPQFLSFLENGGTLFILNPQIRYIDWLPMETKVATQINDYHSHYEPVPQDKIYLVEDQSEIAVNWTSVFFDYDRNYKEMAFNSPVAMTLYSSYILEKIIRTPQQNWPLIYIYKKNI